MNKSAGLWKVMLGVMLVMQAGIAMDYWPKFTSVRWAVHIHYWNATTWYTLLILQPWLVARKNITAHRFWGMIGLLMAGGMVLLSVSQLHRDIFYADFVRDNPGANGPFEPWFFLSVLMNEVVLVTGYMIAVVMAVRTRKSPEDHAWWMASTAFLLLMPALGRGIQNAAIMIFGFSPEITFVVMPPLYLTQVIIISMLLGVAAWIGKLRHPATYLAVAANLAVFFTPHLAKLEPVQAALRAIFQN